MTETPAYVPPKVWTWNKENGGRFANINRPIAGATHDKELPVGKHPLQLYSLATPNGVKVTVMLEELLALGHTGAEYDAWLIRINDGDQFGSGFVAVNPNSKIPALLDRSGPTPIRVFESGAILLLPRREVRRLPADRAGRRAPRCLSWLFWQMGAAPYLGGGFGHFYAYAPTKIEYAIDRFAMEVKRQLDVLDRRLAENEYLAGDDYTIADMAVWPWYGALAKGLLYGAGEFLQVQELQARAALDRPDRRAPGRAARPHGQPRLGRPAEPAPRAPRRQRLRHEDAGQDRRAGGDVAVCFTSPRSAGRGRIALESGEGYSELCNSTSGESLRTPKPSPRKNGARERTFAVDTSFALSSAAGNTTRSSVRQVAVGEHAADRVIAVLCAPAISPRGPTARRGYGSGCLRP